MGFRQPEFPFLGRSFLRVCLESISKEGRGSGEVPAVQFFLMAVVFLLQLRIDLGRRGVFMEVVLSILDVVRVSDRAHFDERSTSSAEQMWVWLRFT